MAGEVLTPNMNLPTPGVGVTSGPEYASDINSCLSILDQHDHSTGSGVQITPNGLNINSDLSINGNNLGSVRSLQLQSQGSALVLASDIRCVYAIGNNLYYNNASGVAVQITNGNSIAGATGSISNLNSPASASYVSGTSTFVWQSAVNTAANMDGGSVLLRNITANSKALTLSPPNAMGADYTIVLPALPVSQKIMTLDASGNMSAPYVVDNSTLEISSNTIRVKDLGITTAKIADGAVTAAKMGFSIPGTTTIYTTPGSYTYNVPAGVTHLLVQLRAGGGGGGTGDISGNGGGGAGSITSSRIVTVTPSTGYTVTVGAGGAGGIGNNTNGTAGGNSSFGSLFVVKGAQSGSRGNIAPNGGNSYAGGGGYGGSSSGVPSRDGQNSAYADGGDGSSAGSAQGGGGGAGDGVGGAGGTNSVSPGPDGQPGVDGGGGGGSFANNVGGAGGNGQAIVTILY